MEIIEVNHEYIKVEKSYTTNIQINGINILITSYYYDGVLAEEETAPAFHQLDKFNALKHKEQINIIKRVNDNLKSGNYGRQKK